MSGLAAATGWADGPPVLVGGAGDPFVAMHVAFAGLVALAERDRSGQGNLVEATMIEAVLNVAAGAPIARQLTATAPNGGATRAATARRCRASTNAPGRTAGSPCPWATTSSGRGSSMCLVSQPRA